MGYKPPTIKELGGLATYLNSDTQKAKHNGLGHKEFAAMVFNETPVLKIMKRMNVKAHSTVDKWIVLYREEQTHG